MHHDFLDRYSRMDSAVHRLPAGVKLVAGAVCLLVCVSTPVSRPWVFATLAVLLLGTAAASRIPPAFLARRLVFLEPFVLLMAAAAAFQPDGLRVVTGILVKSTLSLFCVILLANTTPFSDTLRVLRRIGVPAILLTTLALSYRYLYVLLDELERLQRARASRTFVAGRRHWWRLLSNAVGQLFVRSSERAERIAAAMSARGWR